MRQAPAFIVAWLGGSEIRMWCVWRKGVPCAQMWQDKAGADADGNPVAATTLGENAGNALTPGAVSAVPALAPNGTDGGNGPATPPPSAGRWSFVTGGRSLSMLQPSGPVPK